MRRMDFKRVVAAALLTFAALPAVAAVHLYGVVFGFSVDRSGTVQSLHVVRIMDPRSAARAPVSIPLPPAYLEAVRRLIAAKHPAPTLRDGKPAEAYTWLFYDPLQPGKADIGLPPR